MPSERQPLPLRPVLTSHPQVQRVLAAFTIPLEMLQAVKHHMMQAMRKGLSRETHAQANVRMLPTYICSTPDGTGKAAQSGDGLLCYLQPYMPQWTWSWGRGTGVWPVMGSISCSCTAFASPQYRGRGQELVALASVVVSGSQEPPPWMSDHPRTG